jgi:hypothetical protein
LGSVAAFDLDTTDTYFFGFSDTLSIPITLDGGNQTATGVALVVVPIDATTTGSEGLTMVSHLVDPGDATWIDFGPGYLQVYSSEVTVGWTVPDTTSGNPNLLVSNMFGEVPRNLFAFNWLTGRYDGLKVGGVVDLNRYRSVDGAVLVRATADEPNAGEFQELTVSPYAFTLEWSA